MPPTWSKSNPVDIVGDADQQRYAVHHPWADRLPRDASLGQARHGGDMRLAVFHFPLQGWTDAVRDLHPGERVYTFWKFLRNAWARNAGLRIDHLLLNPPLAARLVAADVDKAVRGEAGASDHAPVWIEIGDAKRRPRKRAR